jgi:DNA-3-methyladenine glycosylase I
MEAPAKIEPKRLGDFLEVMTKAVFQSGMSWAVMNAKWPGFRKAFNDFDAEWVADLSPDDVDRIAQDPAIIRNRRKIQATVENARVMLALEKEFGGFRQYLRSQGDFEATAADLKREFRYMGDFGAFYFLYVVGEEVPSYDEWCARHRAG